MGMGLPFAPIPASVHLVGIGGVGMAGVARLLQQMGCEISGSDVAKNRLTASLEASGGTLFYGHRVANVEREIAWAVRTPAVSEWNPEVMNLRARGVPVYSRGNVLAALCNRRKTIAVAGAHGKTTTSAMLAWILTHCGLEPGYVIGGETALPGWVADLGGEGPLVVEADESDGTLVAYQPHTSILTHLEWDHPERFPTEEALWKCYQRFIDQSGSIWIRGDDQCARHLTQHRPDVNVVGLQPGCDLQLLQQRDHPDGQDFTFCVQGRRLQGALTLPGLHNTWNALMALGASFEEGATPEQALDALSRFPSVARRFQLRESNGVWVVQDYAHHPTEIRAVMTSLAARKAPRLRVVFQPHRYSRTLRLLKEFADAFSGVSTLDLLPVYAASESPSLGVDSDVLAEACRERGIHTKCWHHPSSLLQELNSTAVEGDLIALLGAGDIVTLFEQITPGSPGS